MIRSYRCKETAALFNLYASKRFQAIAKAALRKLDQLNTAEVLDDLRIPPGNHLEPLSGDREGQHSIRINDQWRVCFRWVVSKGQVGEREMADAFDVEIVD